MFEGEDKKIIICIGFIECAVILKVDLEKLQRGGTGHVDDRQDNQAPQAKPEDQGS